ncbi:hypothetical protein HO173_005009 [Letharia columbiana]|uniref:Uncharacterized protein n=1 Tax=Letharia columbiana TaxID=112416 RepID=A0A8H6FXR9_9LECA|nr:uncharacterized protein HO173_005009 [Letharia columbiana]KAF6236718.1 hypothetical protein HO173_005009 [Letharia columbiana]
MDAWNEIQDSSPAQKDLGKSGGDESARLFLFFAGFGGRQPGWIEWFVSARWKFGIFAGVISFVPGLCSGLLGMDYGVMAYWAQWFG